MNENALIIIAKYPEKDSVKTRLKGQISDEQRLQLYVSLLESTIRKLKALPGTDTFIAYAPVSAEDYFARFGTKLIPLEEGGLGERMSYALGIVFGKGYKKASLVGADIPDLSASIILKSFEILSLKDIVYGPARDGGYYLVGMKKIIREIFKDVPWSTDQTLMRSLERAEGAGCSVGFTETLSDIDTIEDLRQTNLLTPDP